MNNKINSFNYGANQWSKFLILLFSFVWVCFTLVSIVEPIYLKTMIGNTHIWKLFRNLDYWFSDNIINHGNFRWEKTIKKINAFTFNLEDIRKAPIVLSVLTWNISYKLYYKNDKFTSIFSPDQYSLIDFSVKSWPLEAVSCIKITPFFLDNVKNEECKIMAVDINSYPYSDLYLYITTYGTDWATINIQ